MNITCANTRAAMRSAGPGQIEITTTGGAAFVPAADVPNVYTLGMMKEADFARLCDDLAATC